jgi:hypothetical protein
MKDHELKQFKINIEQAIEIAELRQIIEPYLECYLLSLKYISNLNVRDKFQMSQLDVYLKCNANLSKFQALS